jgi:hypothetical protein
MKHIVATTARVTKDVTVVSAGIAKDATVATARFTRDVSVQMAPHIIPFMVHVFTSIYASFGWCWENKPKITAKLIASMTIISAGIYQYIHKCGLYNFFLGSLDVMDLIGEGVVQPIGKAAYRTLEGLAFAATVSNEKEDRLNWEAKTEAERKLVARAIVQQPGIPRAPPPQLYLPAPQPKQKYYQLPDGRVCMKGVCRNPDGAFNFGRKINNAATTLISGDYEFNFGLGEYRNWGIGGALGTVLIAAAVAAYKTRRVVSPGAATSPVAAGAQFKDYSVPPNLQKIVDAIRESEHMQRIATRDRVLTARELKRQEQDAIYRAAVIESQLLRQRVFEPIAPANNLLQ